LNVLWNYFKACRLWFAIPFGILYIMANASLLGSNIFLSDWSNEARKDSPVKFSRNMRLLIFTLIGLSQGIFILIGDLVYIKMSLNAAILFHSSMLKSILQSTLEFFEQTPIGRIVNRFNRDIDAVEKNIPDSFKPLVKLLLQILGTILVISFNIPFFAIPTTFLLSLYFTCQVSFLYSCSD
jgi:ATP-binding cassette subfamily C (CFTR/MRP) protein 1